MNSLKYNSLLLAAALVGVSVAPAAEEAGFTMEDSIRQQIFTELKTNVHSLYRDNELLVPALDSSTAGKVAQERQGRDLLLPAQTRAGSPSVKPAETVN